jgi:hypothetical protein
VLLENRVSRGVPVPKKKNIWSIWVKLGLLLFAQTNLKLHNPSMNAKRWQPGLDILRTGIYAAQQFLTPQMRLVTPFTFEDVSQFSAVPHGRIGFVVS